MKIVKNPVCPGAELEELLAAVTEEVEAADLDLFRSVVSVDLADWQLEQVVTPQKVQKRQEAVLATHWHPEFVPMEHIRTRIERTFPNRKEELIIPTQHNVLMSYDGYTGTEVDCYASGFNQKVQLLLHFKNERVRDASVLKSMLAHTFKYRSSQLFDFMHTITRPNVHRLEEAARDTGADQSLVTFVTATVRKIERMLDDHWDEVPRDSLKNKLLRNYFDGLRPVYGDVFINRVQAFLKAVKEIVKRSFSLRYFYRATEVIEETRALGGGIVIPHPEEFWPILLAGYDVDGIEVWNPQSQRYTEFLVKAVTDQNERRGDRPPLLIFMGDDCHMGEKTRPADQQDKAKAAREVGVQPAWDDLGIRKRLIVMDISRRNTIRRYKERLAG